MKYIILLLLVSGCSTSTNLSDGPTENDITPLTVSDRDRVKEYPNCISQVMMADEIPLNFIMNPDCPPYIIDTPRSPIHPRDPEPK